MERRLMKEHADKHIRESMSAGDEGEENSPQGPAPDASPAPVNGTMNGGETVESPYIGGDDGDSLSPPMDSRSVSREVDGTPKCVTRDAACGDPTSPGNECTAQDCHGDQLRAEMAEQIRSSLNQYVAEARARLEHEKNKGEDEALSPADRLRAAVRRSQAARGAPIITSPKALDHAAVEQRKAVAMLEAELDEAKERHKQMLSGNREQHNSRTGCRGCKCSIM